MVSSSSGAHDEASGAMNCRQEILTKLRERRLRVDIATLDYKRVLKAAKNAGIPQVAVAETLGISQPAVTKAMASVDSVPDVLEGKSAASPFELCKRFASGATDRDSLIRELVQWPYAPTGMADEFGQYSGSLSGTFDDVVVAKRMGLIDADVYAEVVARITESQ